VIAQFAHEQAHEDRRPRIFRDLVRGVIAASRELDAALRSSSTARRGSRPDRTRGAAHRRVRTAPSPDVPYRVVINEAIDTTKRFGSEHGHTYVNGVLDHAAAAWRAAEFDARAQVSANEFDLIAASARRARDDARRRVLGIGDDAALLQVPAGRLLVVPPTRSTRRAFPVETAPPTSAGRRSR
jgi:N utilization substance protein B